MCICNAALLLVEKFSKDVLKACKRQCVSSGSSTPSQYPLSSARESGSPSPASSIQEPSSQMPTTSEISKNWQFVETYMKQIGNDKMNWQTCYTVGQRQGYHQIQRKLQSLKL
ncbi:hypothetical protein BDF20DRAFT_839685 [Mycotypha africana]|uniref:uncharacterized protein n=1 Tax=Mycotypha africana TaxID=64632 RepID=UPI0023019D1A|nr:uncharacterized protein BDF20DRAFT_839685 [Mycotypha africana]KAI8968596.1 hypothetical protein BDF20DRAFT_839685 [Mycotypha africana]